MSFGTHSDNGAYDGSTMSGSASDLRAAINNIANWNTDNDITSNVAFVTTGFSVTGSGGAAGDPHIKFANGGTADFRGSHRHSYVSRCVARMDYSRWRL